MIPVIKALYLKHLDEFAANQYLSRNSQVWTYSDEEIAYMEQIRTEDDLLNYTPSPDGKMQALAYDCAIAMGLSKHDGMSAAGDI